MQAVEKYPPAINVLTSMSYGGVKIYDHVHGDMTTRCNPFIRDHLQHLKEASKGDVQARAEHTREQKKARHVARGLAEKSASMKRSYGKKRDD